LPEQINGLGSRTWGSGISSPVEFRKNDSDTSCTDQVLRPFQRRMLVPLNIESQYVDVVNRMLVAKLIEADGSYTFSAVELLEVGHNEVQTFIASEFAAATPQNGDAILARD
jgi:hypothetical protein